ncbi:MAG: acetyl-CoA hydrolase/transferase C-terminal domain-containing protein [Candidatus Nanopelagicales bacterium]|nr:acetyl-CoA hydrolase/transferase C-terminal domain-containing protein [Candidatus Nanopelagicales bacterium]MDZ4248750.1 acetyl-CoA hydrolase/transferase C-terminal domain-containing protein [Candidatus Nanopelagicales bacterium]
MKRITLEQLPTVLSGLPDNPRVVASGNLATPRAILGATDQALERYVLNVLNAQCELPDREGVTYETAFVGPRMRKSPRLKYVPCRLSLVPVLFQKIMRPDVVLIHTSAPHNNSVSLGIEVTVMPAAMEACRAGCGIVIAQANSNMPYTYGDGVLHADEIDYLVEVDEEVPTHASSPPDDVSRQIADRIATLVDDGSTLQAGVGAVPDAVMSGLTERKGLRVWSETFSDGVLDLEQRGRTDDSVPLTASFVTGSRELYGWVHLNRRAKLLRTEMTNAPGRIARQRAMTSINGALQVDLLAQANASRIGEHVFSGIGGSTDFIVGALHSPGGAAYITLPSWHAKANVSTIVPIISQPVTSFQHSAIVTEQGLAHVFGCSEHEQTRNIISQAAHPDTRDELWAAARDLWRA